MAKNFSEWQKAAKAKRIAKLKDKAHRMLQKEGILQAKASKLNNNAQKLREAIVKTQQTFRKLEAEIE